MAYYDEVVQIHPQNRSYLRNKDCRVFHGKDKVSFKPRRVRLDADNIKMWSFEVVIDGVVVKVDQNDKNWYFAK